MWSPLPGESPPVYGHVFFSFLALRATWVPLRWLIFFATDGGTDKVLWALKAGKHVLATA